ncbi:hypothetical protein J0A67_14265 [Algoriphagus aestuariicola]|uniref:Uncharacterized protein n=1 Tax=Algoriphagus aestuariicola TaxID=1852016 RepID=A0ABS3BWF9_9BACT|nr:hypothetical protein [Algoriphagus aestuariicola]MBN7802034.1 hypothetical protein [Algoriphagus aestuariicola]
MKIGGLILPVAILLGCISDPNESLSDVTQVSKLKVKDNTLSFADFEAYEDAIQNPDEIIDLEFRSISRLIQRQEVSSNARILSDDETDALKEYEGSLIVDILDEEKTVVIGERLFYLDFAKKLVAVTKDFSLKQYLIEGDYDSDLVYLFSFEDDVIGLLEEGSTGTILSKKKADLENRRIAAVGSNCDWDECRYDSNTPGDNGYEYRVEAKHVYQSSGVYFKLFSQAKHMKRNSPPLYSGEPTEIQISWDYWFKSKRNSIGIQSDIDNDSKWNDVYEETHYSSSRGLESYRLDSHFYVEVGGNHGDGAGGFAYWDFDLYQIDKGF